MLNQLFNDVFTSTAVKPLTMLEAIGVALVLGLVVAKVYQYKTVYSKSFVMSLALLPSLIAVVIFLVNGSLGAGVAVMGAFSLIRFRSAPGGAKEYDDRDCDWNGLSGICDSFYLDYVCSYLITGKDQFWADATCHAPIDDCHSREFGL